jgi:uncharacterized caspase-like protein
LIIILNNPEIMESVDTTYKKAIIIAIEDYRLSIRPVKYARNDALRFKQSLINDLGFLESEIEVHLDSQAVRTVLEDDVRYEIDQLPEGAQFVFYYAGHGFYHGNHNLLTCWDTNPKRIPETSVSLRDVLMDPLSRSGCRQSLVFLDCCAADLTESDNSRDVIADMDITEFDDFIKPSTYQAIFMSCRPGQKSYSCDHLQNGIWTWHLTEAIAGKQPGAIIKDFYVTANSLQNYLGHAVPEYITKATSIRKTQQPYYKLEAPQDFLIKKFRAEVKEIDKSLPDFRLNYKKAIFRKVDYESIKRAEGFQKNHTLPKFFNKTAVTFVHNVFHPEIEVEVQEIYQKTKTMFSLRKADVLYGASPGGGSVECAFFRYFVDVDLEKDDLSNAKVTRKLEIRVGRSEIPENFDTIFPIYLDEVIIPIEGDIDFDDIVAKFENLAEVQGGKTSDHQNTEIVEYVAPGGTSIKIDVLEKELTITHYGLSRTVELADKVREDLKQISSHKIGLLEG